MAIQARLVSVALFCAALYSSLDANAATATDPMASLYSNNVSVQNAVTNDVSTLIFQPNRIVLATAMRNGQSRRVSGVWTLGSDNATVCLAPSPLGGIALPLTARCLPLAGHVVGDHWTATDDANQALNLTLSAPN